MHLVRRTFSSVGVLAVGIFWNPAGLDATQATEITPRLVPVALPAESLGPVAAVVAVSTNGVVAYTPPPWEGETTAMLRLLDRARGTTFLGVRAGKGPGEVTVVLRWFFEGDSLLHAFDPTTLRISTFTAEGSFLRSHQLTEVGLPVRVSDDSVDLVRGAGLPWSLVRRSLTTGESRIILDESAPGFDRLFPEDPGASTPGRRRQPTVLPPDRVRGEVVVANDLTYAMAAVGASGTLSREGRRVLAPRRRTDAEIKQELESIRRQASRIGRGEDWVNRRAQSLSTEVLPFFHFTHALARDAAGRVWVVGGAPGGEEVFADAFSPNLSFLGRRSISCPQFSNGWDLNGEWLVLLCGRDPETNRSTVRLFRISDRQN